MERRRLGEVEMEREEPDSDVYAVCGHWRVWLGDGAVGNGLYDAADPAREARIKAEALREAHDEAIRSGTPTADLQWLRDRAKRLEESDGVD